MASSRSQPPKPLSLEKPACAGTTQSVSSPDGAYVTSPPFPTTHNRKDSSSTTASTASDSSTTFDTKKPTSPKNVYTHCGRHTDQYLFGGKGLGDLWKAVAKKE